MKRLFIFTTLIALLLGFFAGFMFVSLHNSPAARASDSRHVHVIEHAITDTVQEFHPPHMSLGDVLGFHNPVFDVRNKHQVGHDNGQCTRTVASGKTEWECFWTTFLAGGQITVEGPFFDDGTDTTLTITGGTGIYAGADGSMLLHLRNPGAAISQFDFIFTLVN